MDIEFIVDTIAVGAYQMKTQHIVSKILLLPRSSELAYSNVFAGISNNEAHRNVMS